MYVDTHFFQLGPVPVNAMVGAYDYWIVALSYVIAALASFVALDLAGRLRTETKNNIKLSWFIGGALVMGTGIWSMHFTGMMAFTLSIPMNFDFFWTILSLVIAIVVSGFSLFIVRNENQSTLRLAFGGIFLGFGIAAMHYTGMEGMEMNIDVLYLPGLFTLSIIIAILASEAALWFFIQSNRGSIQRQIRLKILGALILGAAICGMHYTGMAAAVFTPRIENTVSPIYAITHHEIVAYIALITGFFIGSALLFSNYRQLILLSTALDNTRTMQNQLMQSEKMAMVGQLAAGVAHEVNNPIAWVLGNLHYLNEHLNTMREINNSLHEKNIAKFQEVIEESIQGGTRIRDIVRDLNVFSRTDSMIMERVDIHNILNSAINIATPSFKYKASVEKYFDSHVPPLMANSGKLHQVFLNLVMNAAQAIPENNLKNNKMTIVTHVKKTDVQIDITDTGTGISADHLPHIFEPFFTTKLQGEGTGLGLSICHEIIRQLGGRITVQSMVGVGSTFTVHLPIHVKRSGEFQ